MGGERREAKSPLGVSLWFIGCVSLGLGFAWLDDVPGHAILKAALIAALIGLALAALGYVRRVVRPVGRDRSR